MRLRALRLDPGLVHARRVVVADPRLDRRPRPRRVLRRLEDLVQVLAVPLGELVEAAPARLVGRDRVGLAPAAARELVEVHAGVDRRGRGRRRRSGRRPAAAAGAAAGSRPRPRRRAGGARGSSACARVSQGPSARDNRGPGRSRVLPSVHLRAALVLLYLLARLRGLELLPMFLDETLHVRWALLIAQGEKPLDATWKWGRALTIWLGALVTPWADDLLRANRLVDVALGLATLFATVAIARRLFGEREALLAGLFYVFCPFTLFYDRMALTEAGLSALAALTLLLRSAWPRRAVRSTPLAGVSLALAVFVKAIGVLAAPIPFLPCSCWARCARGGRHSLSRMPSGCRPPPGRSTVSSPPRTRSTWRSSSRAAVARSRRGSAATSPRALGGSGPGGRPRSRCSASSAQASRSAARPPTAAARAARGLSARRLLRGADLADAALPAARDGAAARARGGDT